MFKVHNFKNYLHEYNKCAQGVWPLKVNIIVINILIYSKYMQKYLLLKITTVLILFALNTTEDNS